MKFSAILLYMYFVPALTWINDIGVAKAEAAKLHKQILINFSGSDWCGPCIRMHKEILGSDAFKEFAEKNLVIVNADFPRLKKNQLSKDQQKKNDELAEKFNPEGKFPLTILLDETGKVIRQWDGLPNETSEQFIQEVKSSGHAPR